MVFHRTFILRLSMWVYSLMALVELDITVNGIGSLPFALQYVSSVSCAFIDITFYHDGQNVAAECILWSQRNLAATATQKGNDSTIMHHFEMCTVLTLLP